MFHSSPHWGLHERGVPQPPAQDLRGGYHHQGPAGGQGAAAQRHGLLRLGPSSILPFFLSVLLCDVWLTGLKIPTNSVLLLLFFFYLFFFFFSVPMGSHSRCGDVAGYVFDINQPSLPTPVCSVLVSVSVFMAFSTVFHSLHSPNNSPLSHSVLRVLILPYWSCQLHISL